ncbi:hypothetical protein VCHENC02_0655A, partial [Vibrio harveyi]
MVNNLV